MRLSTLTSAEMRVDTHVTGSTTQTLPLSIWDMLFPVGQESQFKLLLAALHARLGISILFRHTKVDDVNGVCALCAGSADEEVVRFDISVDEVSLVDSLDSG